MKLSTLFSDAAMIALAITLAADPIATEAIEASTAHPQPPVRVGDLALEADARITPERGLHEDDPIGRLAHNR